MKFEAIECVGREAATTEILRVADVMEAMEAHRIQRIFIYDVNEYE